jgi:hypothetical protein
MGGEKRDEGKEGAKNDGRRLERSVTEFVSNNHQQQLTFSTL